MQESKYTRDGVNKETYKLLFSSEKEEYKKECSKEIYTIEMSTYRYKRNILYLYYNFLKSLVEMYFYKINYFNIHKNIFRKGYTYKSKGTKFQFDYLAPHLKKILKNEDEYVRKEFVFDLKHSLRYHSCFYKNMIIVANIEFSIFVTGLIPFEDGTYHLHSFVEYKDYVIDYTKNLIMPKEKYYELLKVKELQRMDSANIPLLWNLLLDNKILNTLRYMATFGKEILTDLNKNISLLKTPSESKADFSCLFY